MELRQGEAPLESCACSCVYCTARTITRAREAPMNDKDMFRALEDAREARDSAALWLACAVAHAHLNARTAVNSGGVR